VVREDPKTKGLLFAATERDVYVSFNDGDDWQPLSLNLPHTSVRDLIVKGDDLVIATHGRGFWILDNMTPLRELSRRADQGRPLQAHVGAELAPPRDLAPPARLYKPQTAHRLRRDNWPDTPLPPEFPAGQNPPDGAIVDYYLAADAEVSLDITTAAGAVVRHYSSREQPRSPDEKEINVPMYWARPPQVLSGAKGMHRFVWDLRYPAPGAAQRDFPISAIAGDTPLEPLGVLAVPGPYLVKLTAGGRTYTQPLTLKLDPRASITPPGLARQFTLASKLAGMMNRSYAAIGNIPESKDRKLHADLIALNGDLATAFDVVEGADRAPTTQAIAAVAHLERRMNALLKGTP
jgi:hypothetical protein